VKIKRLEVTREYFKMIEFIMMSMANESKSILFIKTM
jgi:hypothetical protein